MNGASTAEILGLTFANFLKKNHFVLSCETRKAPE